MITWRMRVVGALLLAYFFSMSNGNAFWSTTLPTVLGFGALSTIVVMTLIARRNARP